MQALHGWLSTVHSPRLVRGIFKSFLSYNRKECVKYFLTCWRVHLDRGSQSEGRVCTTWLTWIRTCHIGEKVYIHGTVWKHRSIEDRSITSRENNKCVIINDVVMMDMDYPVPEEFLKTWQASVTELERERHPFTQNAEIEFTRWEIYLDIYRNSGRLKLYLF